MELSSYQQLLDLSKCLGFYEITKNFLDFWQFQGSYSTKKFTFNLKRPICSWQGDFWFWFNCPPSLWCVIPLYLYINQKFLKFCTYLNEDHWLIFLKWGHDTKLLQMANVRIFLMIMEGQRMQDLLPSLQADSRSSWHSLLTHRQPGQVLGDRYR